MLFNWLLWPKYVIFEQRKVQRSYVWWHWRLMQNLKEKWLVLSKMTWKLIELHVLQSLFVRVSNKKQRRGKIISDFTMSYIKQVIVLQCGPPSCTLPKKIFICLSVWTRREYIWKLNWEESLLIYFANFQGAPCSHRQSGNRMMTTFIIVNITPICR